MKRPFEMPELQIQTFDVEDIITTSSGGDLGLPGVDDNMGDWA